MWAAMFGVAKSTFRVIHPDQGKIAPLVVSMALGATLDLGLDLGLMVRRSSVAAHAELVALTLVGGGRPRGEQGPPVDRLERVVAGVALVVPGRMDPGQLAVIGTEAVEVGRGQTLAGPVDPEGPPAEGEDAGQGREPEFRPLEPVGLPEIILGDPLPSVLTGLAIHWAWDAGPQRYFRATQTWTNIRMTRATESGRWTLSQPWSQRCRPSWRSS